MQLYFTKLNWSTLKCADKIQKDSVCTVTAVKRFYTDIARTKDTPHLTYQTHGITGENNQTYT